MIFKVGGKEIEINVSARVPVRYFVFYRKSFITELNGAVGSPARELLIYARLFFAAAYNRRVTDGSPEVLKIINTPGFKTAAREMALVIFNNQNAPRNGVNYGFPDNEFSFLAAFGKSGLPAGLLDEMYYFDLAEIMAIGGDMENPDNYKYKLASQSEIDKIHNISDEKIALIESALDKG
jgi:hypothetical protein